MKAAVEGLPVRIITAPHASALPAVVVSVDGLTGLPGLHLSHWPGNATPSELRHDLSTGCALAFARLAPEERRRLIGDATAFAKQCLFK